MITQLNLFNQGKVNLKEAPVGFYAKEKEFKGYNICRDCEARSLCQKNENNWCIENPCMSYSRKDGESVLFKKVVQ